MVNSKSFPSLGIVVFGVASAAAGILDIIWGDFEAAHQPIQAWGDHIPGQPILAYIAAVWLIAGGIAILRRGTARAGGAALAIIYFIFGVFWLPRFYTAPRVLGFHASVYIGVSGGVAQQIILVVAGGIVYAVAGPGSSEWKQRAVRIAGWIFGLCSVSFGLSHLTGIQVTASFVPKWMPLGGAFWAIVTGICFVLAGIAMLAGVLDVVAARLLALMLLLFSAVVLVPPVFTSPHEHVAWGANAYNLAAVGAAWILAESLAHRGAEREHEASAGPAEAS